MGVINVMCCNDPNDAVSRRGLENRRYEEKVITDSSNNTELTKDGTFTCLKDKKKSTEQLIYEQQIIKVFEEIYPLPNGKKSIKWNSFEVTHRIGGGGFGEVFLAQLKQNKEKGIIEKYAIKRVSKMQIFKKKLMANIQLERRILLESKNNFITNLHYAFRDQKYFYFVMEWAQGGDTYSLVSQGSKRFNDFKAAGEPAVRFILGCLILGMEYLHNENIMYRDLKPENVLIFQNGYAKLSDFGLAKQIPDDKSKTEAGTPSYFAPEMVLREGYGKQIDLWMIGIYAYEISNHSPPFTPAEIRDVLRLKQIIAAAQHNRLWKNPDLSEELKGFINSLLRLDPTKRLGFNSWDELKNHSFFTCVNFDWKGLQEMKLKSPLKSIIDAHRIRLKAYDPHEAIKRVDYTLKLGDYDIPGWTYAED